MLLSETIKDLQPDRNHKNMSVMADVFALIVQKRPGTKFPGLVHSWIDAAILWINGSASSKHSLKSPIILL